MMQAPAAAPKQRALPLSPQPQGPGRSFKNVLAETLVRGHCENLETRYVDSMQDQAQSPTGQLVWTSTVHLVDSSSGVSMMSATGQDSKKTSAQAAAAAALMALPTFEPLLQRLHRHLPAKPLLVLSTPPTSPTVPGPQTPLQPATARPAAATLPGASPIWQQWAAPVTASLAGGNAILVPAASGGMPAVAAATVNRHSAAFPTPSSSATLLPGSLAALGFTPHSCTSQDAAVAPPVAAGLLSAAFASAGTGPSTSTTAGPATTTVVFDPHWNYKGHLQELVQLTKGALQKPAYSCRAEGLPHAQRFTATVFIAPGVAAPPMPAAIPTAAGAPAASLPAAVGGSGGAGVWPAAGVLTATGTPQSTRMKAEQAAAAVALQNPKLLDLFRSGHMLQSEEPASTVQPQPAAQAAQQQQVPLSVPGDTAAQPCSALVSSTALMAAPAVQQTGDTPTQQLNTLVAQARWCLEPICPQLLGRPSHSPIYEARVIINGHLLAVGRANSKAAATHAAAERVLECMRQPAPGMPATDSSSNSMMSGLSPAEVQDASLAVFAQLAQQGISSTLLSAATVTQTALCTILLQRGSSKPAVVALGTGTGFYAGDLQELALPAQRGMLLLDCHGEVVAMRSFLRWLYAQAAMVLLLHKQLQVMQAPGMTAAAAAALQQALDALPLEVVTGPAGSSCSNSSKGEAGGMGDSSNSAHDTAAAAGARAGQLTTHSSSAFAGLKLRLKPDVKLHMYISKVPCGDACEFSKPALRSGGPSTSTNSSSDTSNDGSGRSSSAFHFSTAKPRRQLPSLPLPAQPSQPVPPPLLPSQAALDAHWPQGCALLSPEKVSKSSGRLRFKVRDGENCSPAPSAAEAATQSGAVAAAGSAAAGGSAGAAGTAAAEAGSGLGGFRKMCCSDKVAMRNALGLQGALLGQLLAEPVYLSSLTIGGPAAEFCEGAVCRAVCCRLAPDLSGLCSSTSGGGGGFVGALGGEDCDAQVGISAGRDGDSSSSRASKRQHLMTDDTPVGPTAGSADAGAALGQLQLPAKMAAAADRGLVLPAPYRVNHPRVQYAAFDSPYSRWLPRPGGHRSSSCAESLNWNAAEPDVLEVCSSASGTALHTIKVSPPTDHPAAAAAGAGAGPQVAHMGSGETGESAPGAAAGVMEISSSSSSSSSACSRLSKAALFDWYQELSKSAGECAGVLAADELQDTDMQSDQHRPHTAGTGTPAGDDSTAATGGAAGVQASYAAAKARNVGYMATKALLHQHFQHRVQQDWLKVTAVVPELEQFTA